MQILVSKYSGFCNGVKRAVALAVQGAKQEGKVYTVGKLIHNTEAVQDLQKQGVFSVDSIADIPKGGVAVIRSHGTGRADYTQLEQLGIRYIDATCPSVKAIHNKVSSYSDNGYHIIVVGNPNHPEVKGILGWCKNGTVISSCDDVQLPQNADKILLVAQTTLDTQKYEDCCNKVVNQAKINAKLVEIFNTICYTTIARQKSAEAIAKASQAVFVIGDTASSNTNTLLGIASKHCSNTVLIQNVSDLQSVADISKNITKLGVVASASAPQRLIMEVINRMDQENKVDIIVADEVTPVAEEPAVQATEEVKIDTSSSTTAAPQKDKTEEPMTMEKAMGMKHYGVRSFKEGSRLKAKIVSVDPSGIAVAIEGSGKNDSGFIDKDEVEIDGSFNPDNYTVDMMLDVVVIPKTADKSKGINLSKKAFDIIRLEDEAVKKILEGEEFTLVCNQAIKGGLLGHIGTYTIFVPASQIRMGFVKNLEEYVGKKLRLRILPPKEDEKEVAQEGYTAEAADATADTTDTAAAETETSDAAASDTKEEAAAPRRRSNPKRIVAGQRAILEEEKQAREEAFWEIMQVNNIIKGKVKRFTPFGAFVSIMNFDCLAHISDLSWTKINDPSEVLTINKSYDFVVIKVDKENGKVSLGYKQLQKKPYELAAEKYHVGDVVKGKVERIKDFGAFIEIEPGIDGLVHVSEIGYKWIANANEALKVGDEVEAKIIGFENNKITLSIKQLLPPPEIEELDTESDTDKQPSRTGKFNKRLEGADTFKDKKERKPRRDKEDSDEPREWVSSTSGGATFADLFKDLDFNNFEGKDED